MGYNLNKKSIDRVQTFLDQLSVGTTKLEWSADNPAKISYYIREGIKAAAKFAFDSDGKPLEPYYSYTQIPAKYIIRIANTRLIAEPRLAISSDILKVAHSVMTIHDVNSVLEVIGAAIKHKAAMMTFPDFVDDVNLDKLYNWTSINGYYIVKGDDAITLTKEDSGVSWTPSE